MLLPQKWTFNIPKEAELQCESNSMCYTCTSILLRFNEYCSFSVDYEQSCQEMCNSPKSFL